MPLCDLLRVSVLLVAGVATVLGAVSAVVANREGDATAITVAAAWWLAAIVVGIYLGRASASGSAMSRVLARSRTATSLPVETPARIALGRLWPVGAFAIAAGAAGWFWPQVSAIGAGYAILTALSWRGRERAVAAIEARDGVRFYVEPTSAFEPLRVVRTPGLYRDRPPKPKPPPPAPAG